MTTPVEVSTRTQIGAIVRARQGGAQAVGRDRVGGVGDAVEAVGQVGRGAPRVEEQRVAVDEGDALRAVGRPAVPVHAPAVAGLGHGRRLAGEVVGEQVGRARGGGPLHEHDLERRVGRPGHGRWRRLDRGGRLEARLRGGRGSGGRCGADRGLRRRGAVGRQQPLVAREDQGEEHDHHPRQGEDQADQPRDGLLGAGRTTAVAVGLDVPRPLGGDVPTGGDILGRPGRPVVGGSIWRSGGVVRWLFDPAHRRATRVARLTTASYRRPTIAIPSTTNPVPSRSRASRTSPRTTTPSVTPTTGKT